MQATRGFTLIELLVVLVILGIMTTAVALSITTDPARAVTSDVKRLSLLLEAAMIEAQAGKRQLAWSSDATGYEFWEAESSNERERQWQPLAVDERFQPHRFAAGLRLIRLDNEGQELPQGSLLVFRRGDPPLFRIVLEGPVKSSGQADKIVLRGLPTGRVEILSGTE
ncbi:MAG: prepilin-type N-terminal cleavage/methylation domain-containing protein [Sterolibacterium sp.]|jgi:type II secretion system protein H